MLKELLEKVHSLMVPNRLTVNLGIEHSALEYVFNYRDGKYERISVPKLVLECSCIDSFVAAVIESCKRADKPTGNFSTATLNEQGGQFSVDDQDRFNDDMVRYNRKLSEGYEALRHLVRQQMDHNTFLRQMQRFQNLIPNFPELFKEWRRIRLNSSVTVNSSPIIGQGEKGSTISLATTLNGGPNNADLPGSFVVRTPIAAGSSFVYDFHCEVDAWLDEKSKCVMFQVINADADVLFQKGLSHEREYFRSKMAEAELTDMLILLNY